MLYLAWFLVYQDLPMWMRTEKVELVVMVQIAGLRRQPTDLHELAK
jgi:hypothetical protein